MYYASVIITMDIIERYVNHHVYLKFYSSYNTSYSKSDIYLLFCNKFLLRMSMCFAILLNCIYTVYDKTFEGENFCGFRRFGSTVNVFPRIFPSKFFSNNIASSSSLFLVVQIMVYKEYRNTEKEGSAG